MIDVDFDYRSQNDEVTQKMAQLLLKGWTMLSENCLQCTEVPLMRSKDGSSLCCKCSKVTGSRIPPPKPEESDRNTNDCKIDPYVPFGQISLNGGELEAIHNENCKVDPGSSRPPQIPLQKSGFDFQAKQLRLLEVQVNRSLSRYSGLLSLRNEDCDTDFDSDSKIIGNIQGLLNVLMCLKKLD